MRSLIRTSFTIVFLGLAILSIGCATKGPSFPDWYLNIPDDADNFYAVAMAESGNMQFAIDKARNNARVELTQQLQSKVSGLFKQFREETGSPEDAEFVEHASSVSKLVVSEAINGSRVSKQEIERTEESKIYKAFVMMRMPIGDANAALVARIRANNHLYTRFRASKGYKELEKEAEEYEQWKNNQGL